MNNATIPPRAVTPRAVIRHAAPTLLETTVIPIALFSAVAGVAGLRLALAANLAWSTIVLVRHLASDRRVPGTMVIGAVDTLARCAILLLGGGAVLYFAQPVAGTVATALAFFVSSVTGRPLAALLGADFIPLPADAWREPRIRRACSDLSVIWGVALLANAGETLWILQNFGPRVYMLCKLVIAATTTLPAVAASALIARRTRQEASLPGHVLEAVAHRQHSAAQCGGHRRTPDKAVLDLDRPGADPEEVVVAGRARVDLRHERYALT